jgi:hypothetical protein
MTFASQWALTYDDAFWSRSQACITQQADFWVNDERGDIKGLSESLMRGGGQELPAFQRAIGASPGFAEKVDNGDGTITSDRIEDGEILATVQALWPTMAELFFTSDGTPKGNR